MTDSSKLAKIKGILALYGSNPLRSAKGRKILARRIGNEIGMYHSRVEEFLDEMCGLDLSNVEERELFMQFVQLGL